MVTIDSVIYVKYISHNSPILVESKANLLLLLSSYEIIQVNILPNIPIVMI